jgi:hypothetical protein
MRRSTRDERKPVTRKRNNNNNNNNNNNKNSGCKFYRRV